MVVAKKLQRFRIKAGKLSNVIEHISNKKDSFQYHNFDIQGAVFLFNILGNEPRS